MKKKFLFNKKDYKILIVGLIFIATGFILMSGGGSDDPNIFNNEIYNFRRIRLSPTLVIFGFVIIFLLSGPKTISSLLYFSLKIIFKAKVPIDNKNPILKKIIENIFK